MDWGSIITAVGIIVSIKICFVQNKANKEDTIKKINAIKSSTEEQIRAIHKTTDTKLNLLERLSYLQTISLVYNLDSANKRTLQRSHQLYEETTDLIEKYKSIIQKKYTDDGELLNNYNNDNKNKKELEDKINRNLTKIHQVQGLLESISLVFEQLTKKNI